SAFPSARMPLPASRISSVPSSPVIWTQEVLPPNPAVSEPGVGSEPRTPHIRIRISLVPPRQRPENDDGAVVPGGTREWQRAGLDLEGSRLGPHREVPVRRTGFSYRNRERHVVRRQRLAVGAERH